MDGQGRLVVADLDPDAIRGDHVGTVELPDDVRLRVSGEGDFELGLEAFLDANLAKLLGDLGRVLLLYNQFQKLVSKLYHVTIKYVSWCFKCLISLNNSFHSFFMKYVKFPD